MVNGVYRKSHRMIKLLQINVSANWGSTGKIAEQINQAANCDCWLAYSRHANPSASRLIRIGGKLDVLWSVVETRLLDRAGLSMRRATKNLIRQIQTIQPDIIHLHNIHGYVINFKILFEYLNSTSIKVVWTFHDFWAMTGHCAHFIDANCEKWKQGCHHCPKRNRYPKSFTDFSARNYSLKKRLFMANPNLHIVAVSEWVANYVRESFFKDKDVRVIHNGADLQVFQPTAGFIHCEIEPHDFVILAVASRWTKYAKGFQDYMALSKLLTKDEKIVLVGISEELAAELPENVIGIMRTNSQEELAAIYSRANVVVSFSPAETFGMTIVEGYACGTPAVVYNNTAPPYLITPQTGFVVPDKDYKSAYQAIQEIKSKDKEKYSYACIQIARCLYDKDKCFQQYVELYEELLNEE